MEAPDHRVTTVYTESQSLLSLVEVVFSECRTFYHGALGWSD